MENQIRFNINNEIYSNNNNLLLDVVNRLENLLTENNLQIIIPRIKDIIIIINKVISNNEQIRKDIQNLNNNINEKFKNLELNINNNIINNNKQIKIYNNGKYEGEMLNDKKEGKGIFYYNDGGRYEGDWKNDLREGKGIYHYYSVGGRYDGDWKNGKREGKGIFYHNNGDIYEGDWENDLREGKGIYILL